MCNDTYRWLEDPTEPFHRPEDLFSVCSSLLPLSPLATTDLFTVIIVLSLPEVGILQHVASSHWFLSLDLLFNLFVFTFKVRLSWTACNWIFVIGQILQKHMLSWSLLCRVSVGVSNCGMRGGGGE